MVSGREQKSQSRNYIINLCRSTLSLQEKAVVAKRRGPVSSSAAGLPASKRRAAARQALRKIAAADMGVATKQQTSSALHIALRRNLAVSKRRSEVSSSTVEGPAYR